MPQPEREDAIELLADLGITIDPGLLDRALTHRSYAYEKGGLPTNERLEFLGDAVLQLVVTEHLYAANPEMSEGQLAKLRAAVVNSRALAGVARTLDLGSLVKVGRGEESTGGRDKSSILADTMEAVIGAVFEQRGIADARRFLHRLFDELMAEVATLGAGLDWKTSLQEICSVNGLAAPQYQVTESGPDHAKTFTATVLLDGGQYGPGTGQNKKEAEQKAAAAAFAALRERYEPDSPPTSPEPVEGPEPTSPEPVEGQPARTSPEPVEGPEPTSPEPVEGPPEPTSPEPVEGHYPADPSATSGARASRG